MRDYYRILGVSPSASLEDIRKRFRFLAHAYHPDKFASDTHKQNAENEFKLIREAYDILSNSRKRKSYDSSRASGSADSKDDASCSPPPSGDDGASADSVWLRAVVVASGVVSVVALVSGAVYFYFQQPPRANRMVGVGHGSEINAGPRAASRRAAEQGDVVAQVNLGFKYRDGQGVKRDYAEAAKWYRKAAEQGDAVAQRILGFMYRYGEGVEKDYVEAYAFLNLAAAKGDDDSRAARDWLEIAMTPQQIDDGQKRTKALKLELEKARTKKK